MWIAAAIAAVIVVANVWGVLRGYVASRWLRESAARIEHTVEEIDAKDAAIRNLAQEIAVFKRAADEAQRRAVAAEAKAQVHAQRARNLEAAIETIRRERAALKPLETFEEIRHELARLGIR